MSFTAPTNMPKFHDELDFIVFNKPYGFRTHKGIKSQLGLIEVLSEKLSLPLMVTHTLGQDISGGLLLAKSKQSQAHIMELFENKKVRLMYYFLTDRALEKKEFYFEAFETFEDPTQFKFIKNVGSTHFLWSAESYSPKSDQVRVHAKLSGIPILGDTKNEGSPWFQLKFHAAELKFEYKGHPHTFITPLPTSFTENETALSAALADQWQSQNLIYNYDSNDCFRLIHKNTLNIQADVYGNALWIYWYQDQLPTEIDLKDIQEFSNKIGKHYIIRHMVNRGYGVGGQEKEKLFPSPDAPTEWTAHENGLKFKLKQNSGFSPGLFLDQSENRYYVLNNSSDKNVLNLFSYTSGFSVAAALGGAKEVTSVDASTSFLEWSKVNFKLNEMNPTKHEFFSQDTLLFLSGAKKRKRKWDLIICDPPSFGRTKTTIWKIEKDLPTLAKEMWDCLAEKGEILFTCNYEQWTLSEVIESFASKLKSGKYEILPLPAFRLDIELPDADNNLMKGFRLRKL